MAKSKPVMESADPDPAGSLTPPAALNVPEVEAGETQVCKSKAEALHAIDELGYPVMVDGTVHEKKVWAIGAVEKVFGEGKGGAGQCVVARPKFV